MTSKHEWKNAAVFLDVKKGANPVWSRVQLLSSGLVSTSDGLMVASIQTDLAHIESPTTVIDGTAFLKAVMADVDCRIVPDSPNTLTVGDQIFETEPTMRANCYHLLSTGLLAGNDPTTERSFGLLASHTSSLGKVKDLKGKPDVVKLSFRGKVIAFFGLSTSLTGIVMANTHPEIEQGVLL